MVKWGLEEKFDIITEFQFHPEILGIIPPPLLKLEDSECKEIHDDFLSYNV